MHQAKNDSDTEECLKWNMAFVVHMLVCALLSTAAILTAASSMNYRQHDTLFHISANNGCDTLRDWLVGERPSWGPARKAERH